MDTNRTQGQIPVGSDPAASDGDEVGTVGSPAAGSWGADVTASDHDESTATVDDQHLRTNQHTDLRDDDTITVPVHEEELTATKSRQQAGEVQITKDVVEENRTIEVPITEERVKVTRRVVDQEAGADTDAFQGGTIEVPLTTEQVNLGRRVKVSEEIEIDREEAQTTQQVSGTVRREVVDVAEVETDPGARSTDS